MHDRGARAEHPGDRVGLSADGSDLGEFGDLVVDVEHVTDASSRRGVEDDGVVGERRPRLRAAAAAAPHGLVDLADDEDVTHAGGDRRGEVDGSGLLEDRPGAAELVEDVEVFEQGGLDLDGQAPHLTAAGDLHEQPVLDRQRRHVEHLADALTSLDLDEEDAAPEAREREREGCGDRRLARATLAADDVQPDPGPVREGHLARGVGGAGGPGGDRGRGGGHALTLGSAPSARSPDLRVGPHVSHETIRARRSRGRPGRCRCERLSFRP